MSKIRLFFYLTVVIISLSCLNYSYSQTDCPGEHDPCPLTSWNTGYFQDFSAASGTGISVLGTYKYRICNGVVQIKDIDITFQSTDFFNSGSNYEDQFDGLKQYVELQVLSSYLLDYLGGVDALPLCGDPMNPPKLMASIYSADCGVWLRCSYEFDCEPFIYSDGPSQTGYVCENPWNNNGKKVIDKWHWEPCGDVCCEKTYEICKEYSATAAGMILKINNVNRHKLPGSECSKEGQFFKWDTSTPIPCNDGCQGDGN